MENGQGSYPDLDLEHLTAIGPACAALVVSPSTWVNRQVETIELLSHEGTRRRISVDFTLPSWARDPLNIGHGIVVPLGILSKERRKNFDLRDESNASLPALGRRQNGQIAHSALCFLAFDLLEEDLDDDRVYELIDALWNIVSGEPAKSLDRLSLLIQDAGSSKTWLKPLFEDSRFLTLCELLSVGYILFTVLPENTPPRRVIKVSYGTEFNPRPSGQVSLVRPDHRGFFIDCSLALWGGSYHLEIALPEELRASFSTFAYEDEDGEIEIVGDVEVNVDRVSLYAPEEAAEQFHYFAAIEIAPERVGQISQGLGLGLLVTLTLTCALVSNLGTQTADAAVSILLAGAALFSGLSASSGSHVLVRQVFSGARRATAFISAAAVLGALALAFELPGPFGKVMLVSAAALAALATIRLLLSWHFAASDSALGIEEF